MFYQLLSMKAKFRCDFESKSKLDIKENQRIHFCILVMYLRNQYVITVLGF